MSNPSPEKLLFHDSSLAVTERIEDLLQRLTVAEKIHQLMHDSPALERLEVPAYNWWNEACHGVGRNGQATIFPQVIGLAATWDRDLIRAVADAIADEARAKHAIAVEAGRHGQYQGLTFWTPNINIFRDPRWGRGQETFGEDPYLTGELGVAMVQGLQGSDPDKLKVAACAKHFAVHSGPESERHAFDAAPSLKDFHETYLPAFEKLVRAGVESVMGAYNRLFGEPCCGSHLLLEVLLREKWGFKGHVVSDCGAVADFHEHHHVTVDGAESAALALREGCDLNCGCTYGDLLLAIQQGLITEEEIDRSLRRLLSTRFRLGLFNPPAAVVPQTVINSPEHRRLAMQAAADSVVLLKNKEQILPLKDDLNYVLVTGPSAGGVAVLLGNYYGVNSELVTILEGIVGRVSPATRVEYRAGCQLAHASPPGINWTLNEAAEADVVIAVLGYDPSLEGEEGDAVASAHAGDRPTIELPAHQLAYLTQLRARARKLVLVLTGGGPVAVPEAHDICDAILQVWYPGCEGGRAVAAVLYGDVNPSGKLPVSVPHRTEDLPAFNDYTMAGRTYRFARTEALYPFGFGLSYTAFKFDDLTLSADQLESGQSLRVSVTVQNIGKYDGRETVQCYLVPPRHQPDTPLSTLIAFDKITLKAGESTQVEFQLGAEALLQYDSNGDQVWVAGQYRIVIGGASPGPRAEKLGAAVPAEADLTLI